MKIKTYENIVYELSELNFERACTLPPECFRGEYIAFEDYHNYGTVIIRKDIIEYWSGYDTTSDCPDPVRISKTVNKLIHKIFDNFDDAFKYEKELSERE